MKVYDKEIYSKQESIKTIAVVIIVFLLGFFAGYAANAFNSEDELKNTNSTYVEEDVQK